MSLTENGSGTGMYMPVAPAYAGGYGNNGFGGDGWWILLLLLAFGGGWGMGGFGGGMLGYDFPWLLNGQQSIMSGVNANTDAAVNQLATQTAFGNLQNAITSGFGDVQNSLCGGFAGVNSSISGAQNAISQQLYANQIADMQNSFAMQSKFADCCCENRLATANLSALVQSENCADREALSNGVRDLLTNQTANTQRILDKLCDQELQAERRENDNLRTQLNMANLAASQTAQTAQILADNARQTAILNPAPIPAYIVQNPSCCNQGYGCGCGNNGFIG